MRGKNDPIALLKEQMLSNNMASAEELKVRTFMYICALQVHHDARILFLL